jgi:16S rRNA (uracil1498-N3)-methyltransferase
MPHRFFLPPENFRIQQVQFPQTTAHQIQRVLRLAPGDLVIVLDNLGSQYSVRLEKVSMQEVSGLVLKQEPVTGEPVSRLTLLLALTQREKFEWMLQKCTELGAAAFMPLVTSRSLVQDKIETSHKHTRWETILREAAEQSGRGRIPVLFPPVDFQQALQFVTESRRTHPDPAWILWEAEREDSLKAALRTAQMSLPLHPFLLVGPEGGFSPQEVQAASLAGFQPVSLGKRILRMETAAIAATTLVLYELGELETR